MPKSKYPNQIDTSIEIPAVRDNITEIGSDVINSIRSAIFSIEQALGILPNGQAGQTLADRLNQALDENGNIKPDALSLVNVLSGPILDNDISSVAAIKESKLKLDFPTKILQSEISSLNFEIDHIISSIDLISSQLSSHLYPNTPDRHTAYSISVSSASEISSDESTNNLPSNNLQLVLEEIYSGHINLSSDSISLLNNAHESSQIYFDSSEVGDVTSATDLQSAVVDIANYEQIALRNNTLNTHSNGRIRTGTVFDGYEFSSYNHSLVTNEAVTYTFSNGASRTTFVFTNTPSLNDEILRGDVLVLSGSENEEDNKEYQIDYVSTNPLLVSVTVFGGPKKISLATLSASIYKNSFSNYNLNGLNSAVRPRANKTNTPDVIVCNPNAATIVSSGFHASNISVTQSSFSISIDNAPPIDVSLYDSFVSSQSIDSAVNKANEFFIDNHMNALAFKIKVGDSYELAISHSVPNFSGDKVDRSILISNASSNDGASILGFSSYIDKTIYGTSGNDFLINGIVKSDIIDLKYFSGNKIQLNPSDNKISILDDVFSEYGIGVGDTVTITGSSDPSDDGTFRVSSISGSIITLDGSYLFLGQINEDSIVIFQKNSARLEEMNFEEISGSDGAILFDIFIDNDSRVLYSKRLEIESSLTSGAFYAAVVDISRDFITQGQTGSLTINTDGTLSLTGPDLVAGSSVFVASPGFYKVFSASGLSYVVVQVKNSGLPAVPKTINLYGFNELSRKNYRISRGLFSTSLGRVFGEYLESGVPTLIDKRRSGTVDDTIVSESFIEKYIEGPRNELRASGVISGCEVTSVTYNLTYYELSISPGVFVSNGIRHEFSGEASFVVNIDSDFYLAFDEHGCLRAEKEISYSQSAPPELSSLVSPFYMREVVLLGKIFTTQERVDCRLFIDRSDYKVLKEIIVSYKKGFGHFSNIKSAVEYAKIFSYIYPTVGIPSIYIAPGTYLVSETIYIDTDMDIRGSGVNTIIKKAGNLALGVEPRFDSTHFDKIVPDMRSCIFYIGNLDGWYSAGIKRGVSIGNFTYITSDTLASVGSVISISGVTGRGPFTNIPSLPDDYNPTYRIYDINFIGTDDMFYSSDPAQALGEFAICISKQNNDVGFTEPGFASNAIMGSCLITGCRFHSFGVEKGPVYVFADVGTIKDIITSQNISTDQSPNLNDTDFGILQLGSSTYVGLQRVNIIQSSNAVNY